MKHLAETDAFLNTLERQGVKLTQTQKKQLVMYYKFILTWNRKINLVSRVETRKNLFHHFVASIVYGMGLEGLGDNSKIVDLGSGGGFPGMVLAILFPGHRFVLVDSSRKKTLFLKTVSREIGLDIEIVNTRIEDLKLADQDLMNAVVARGLAPIPELLAYSRPLLKKSGLVISLKGVDYVREFEEETDQPVITEIAIENKWKKVSERLNDKVLLKVEC